MHSAISQIWSAKTRVTTPYKAREATPANWSITNHDTPANTHACMNSLDSLPEDERSLSVHRFILGTVRFGST